jgi:hypothetical protein
VRDNGEELPHHFFQDSSRNEKSLTSNDFFQWRCLKSSEWVTRKQTTIDSVRPKNDRKMYSTDRVTRWGEFSPIGWLFTLGIFLKITELCSPYFWATFSRSWGYALILAKNCFGFVLSYFLKNSSGRPVNRKGHFLVHAFARIVWQVPRAFKQILKRSKWQFSEENTLWSWKFPRPL